MKTTNDIAHIVACGGGIIIDASKTTNDLAHIASCAATSGATVIIRGAGSKTTNDLAHIGSCGKGRVIFEL